MAAGSIRKLKPADPASPWVFEYTDPDTGKRVRKTPKSGKKKDAEAIRARIVSELFSGTHVVTTATFGAAAASYLKECQERVALGDLSRSRFENIESAVKKHIAPHLGGIALPSLSPSRVQALINLKGKDFGFATLVNLSSAIRLVIKHAMRQRWIKVDPLGNDEIRLPKRPASRKIPDEGTIRRLLEFGDERPAGGFHRSALQRGVIIRLGVFAGLRAGEMGGLDWEHVDFDSCTLRVRQSMSYVNGLKGTKTENSERDIPIDGPVIEALQALADVSSKPLTGPLLLSRRAAVANGKPHPFAGRMYPQTIWKVWAAACKVAGVTNDRGSPLYRLHDLRHVAISLHIAEGLSPKHIQRFAGHSRITTTMDTYGHLFPEDQSIRQSLRGIASRFSAPTPAT